MNEEKVTIYRWDNIHWDIIFDPDYPPEAIALCPKLKCHCRLIKLTEPYKRGEYKYCCAKCDFKITLNKPIEEKAKDFLLVIESKKYENAEIVNIDGELISVQRSQIKDTDYWIDVKLSKDKKNNTQLMILAGSKKDQDKTQLFLDFTNERLAFDQNNDHPSLIFTKVTAIFKNTIAKIVSKEDELF